MYAQYVGSLGSCMKSMYVCMCEKIVGYLQHCSYFWSSLISKSAFKSAFSIHYITLYACMYVWYMYVCMYAWCMYVQYVRMFESVSTWSYTLTSLVMASSLHSLLKCAATSRSRASNLFPNTYKIIHIHTYTYSHTYMHTYIHWDIHTHKVTLQKKYLLLYIFYTFIW